MLAVVVLLNLFKVGIKGLSIKTRLAKMSLGLMGIYVVSLCYIFNVSKLVKYSRKAPCKNFPSAWYFSHYAVRLLIGM